MCNGDANKSHAMGLADVQGVLFGLYGLLLFATIVLAMEVVYSYVSIRVKELTQSYHQHPKSGQKRVRPLK